MKVRNTQSKLTTHKNMATIFIGFFTCFIRILVPETTVRLQNWWIYHGYRGGRFGRFYLITILENDGSELELMEWKEIKWFNTQKTLPTNFTSAFQLHTTRRNEMMTKKIYYII